MFMMAEVLAKSPEVQALMSASQGRFLIKWWASRHKESYQALFSKALLGYPD